MWSTAYMISWKRTEHALAVEWDMLEFSSRAALRPDFRGTFEDNPLNTSEKTKQFPKKWKTAYSVFSTTVTVIFLGLSFISILACRGLEPMYNNILDAFIGDLNEPPRGKTLVSVTIAVLIQVFNFLWSFIAKQLVNLENPRTDAEYASLLVWKLAPFSLFTAYNTFIWVALFQGYLARH